MSKGSFIVSEETPDEQYIELTRDEILGFEEPTEDEEDQSFYSSLEKNYITPVLKDVYEGVKEAPWVTQSKFYDLIFNALPQEWEDPLREYSVGTMPEWLGGGEARLFPRTEATTVTGDIIGTGASTALAGGGVGQLAHKWLQTNRMLTAAVASGIVEMEGRDKEEGDTLDAVAQIFKGNPDLYISLATDPEDNEAWLKMRRFLVGVVDSVAADKIIEVAKPIFKKFAPLNRVEVPEFDKAAREEAAMTGTLTGDVNPNATKAEIDKEATGPKVTARPYKPIKFTDEDLDFDVPPREIKNWGTDKSFFNHKNINTSEDIHEYIKQVSETIKNSPQGKRLLKKQGKAAVTSKAGKYYKQIANQVGGTYEEIVRTAGETKDLAPRFLAIRRILYDSATIVKSLSKVIEEAEFDPKAMQILNKAGFNNIDEAIIFVREEGLRYTAMQAEVKGIQSNIARALQAMRYQAKTQQYYGDNLQRVMDSLGGQKVNMRLIKMINRMHHPDQIAKVFRHDLGGKMVDSLVFIAMNGMLSNPKTISANSGGALSMLAMVNAEHWLAAVYGGMERTVLKGVDKFTPLNVSPRQLQEGVTIDEAKALSFGLNQALIESVGIYGIDALKKSPAGQAVKAFKKRMPSDMHNRDAYFKKNPVSADNWDVSAYGVKELIDYFGILTDLPGRMLLSNDEFFKGLNYRMYVHALSMRQAVKEGFQGKEAVQRYEQIIRALPEDIHYSAMDMAAKNVFQEPFQNGSFLKKIEDLRQTQQFIEDPEKNFFTDYGTHLLQKLGNSVFLSNIPFLRTILRLGKEGPARPLVGAAESVTTDPVKRQLGVAKTVTGAIPYFVGYQLAKGGMLSSVRSSNRTEFYYQVLEGAPQPSIQDPKDPKRRLGVGQLDPFITPITLGALAHQYETLIDTTQFVSFEQKVAAKKDIQEAFADVFYTFRSMLADKTLLQGVSDIVASIDPDASTYERAKPFVNWTEFMNPALSFYSANIRAVNKTMGIRPDNRLRNLEKPIKGFTEEGSKVVLDYRSNREAYTGEIAKDKNKKLIPDSPLEVQGRDWSEKHWQILEYLYKHHLAKIEEKYSGIFSYDSVTKPKLDMFGNELGKKLHEYSVGERLVMNTLYPGQVALKNDSVLFKRVQQLNIKNIKHPSLWTMIDDGISSHPLPLTPQQKYDWAKEYGKLNKELEKDLKKPSYQLIEEQLLGKKQKKGYTASELRLEIKARLRGNKIEALQNMLFKEENEVLLTKWQWLKGLQKTEGKTQEQTFSN